MPIDEGKTFLPVRIAVLTISDSRRMADDRSGQTLVDRLTAAGHVLADRSIVTGASLCSGSAWISSPSDHAEAATTKRDAKQFRRARRSSGEVRRALRSISPAARLRAAKSGVGRAAIWRSIAT